MADSATTSKNYCMMRSFLNVNAVITCCSKMLKYYQNWIHENLQDCNFELFSILATAIFFFSKHKTTFCLTGIFAQAYKG